MECQCLPRPHNPLVPRRRDASCLLISSDSLVVASRMITILYIGCSSSHGPSAAVSTGRCLDILHDLVCFTRTPDIRRLPRRAPSQKVIERSEPGNEIALA